MAAKSSLWVAVLWATSIPSCTGERNEVISGGVYPAPAVRVSMSDYQEAQIRGRVPDRALLRAMRNQVGLLNLDVARFDGCLKATGQALEGVISLPYLGEKARYEGHEAWIFITCR